MEHKLAVSDNRTLIYYYKVMDGREFVRRARRYARKKGLDFHHNPGREKGSHGELYLGGRRTIVKTGELSKGLLTAMLKQLDINRKEF